ncbi:MAG: hypothetical protein ACRDT2_10680 [Natronosporangium sp.]
MTKKLTISVPDRVADRLAQEDNVSAFVTQAVERVMTGEEVRRRHRGIGFHIPEEDIRRAAAEHDRLLAGVTPELQAEAEQLAREIRTRDPVVLKGPPSARRD